MTGAGIFDGYILVVDKAKRPQPGDVVLAIVGAEFLVKRLQFDCEGRAMLMARSWRCGVCACGYCKRCRLAENRGIMRNYAK